MQCVPFAYQANGTGKTAPASQDVLRQGTLSLQVGHDDTTRPLVIDSNLSYSDYLGGPGEDKAYGVAVDPPGNPHRTGSTAGSNFPNTTRD